MTVRPIEIKGQCQLSASNKRCYIHMTSVKNGNILGWTTVRWVWKICLTCMHEAMEVKAVERGGSVVELQQLSKAIESRRGVFTGSAWTASFGLNQVTTIHSVNSRHCVRDSREWVRSRQLSWFVNRPSCSREFCLAICHDKSKRNVTTFTGGLRHIVWWHFCPDQVGESILGDHTRERVKEFTYDYAYWSACHEDRHYVAQEQVCIISTNYEGHWILPISETSMLLEFV